VDTVRMENATQYLQRVVRELAAFDIYMADHSIPTSIKCSLVSTSTRIC